MEIYTYFFLKAFGIYLGLIVWFFLFGLFINRTIKLNSNVTIISFTNILLGLFYSIIIYSLYYTNGNTILIIPLIISALYYFFYLKKSKVNTQTNINYKEVILIAIIGIFIFTLNAFIRFKGSDVWPIFSAGKDEIFYSLVTNFTQQSHIENPNIDWFFFNGQIQLYPYHYTEQWLNLFIINNVKILSLHSLLFIVYPLFQFVLFIGIYSTFKQARNGVVITIFLALAILFFQYPSINFWKNYSISLSSFNIGLKYYPIYWLFIILFQLILNKKHNEALILFSLFPFINYGFYPIILSTLLIYIFTQKILLKKSTNWFIILSYTISIIGIGIISYLNPGDIKLPHLGINTLIDFYFDDTLIRIKRVFIMGIAYIVQNSLSLFSLLIIILIFLSFKLQQVKRERYTLLFIFTIILSSLGIASILYFILDTAQIFNMFFKSIATISIIFIISLYFRSSWNIVKWPFITIIILQLLLNLNIYHKTIKAKERTVIAIRGNSINYLNKIKLQIKAKPKQRWIGARYYPDNYYKSIYDIRSIDQYEGFPFAFFTNKLNLVTFNNVPIIEDKYGVFEFNHSMLTNSEYFVQYCKANNYNINNKNDLEAAQLKYIRDKKVSFLIIYKGAKVPESILTLPHKEYIDPLSKEKLILFN